jgi:hypothetical protein
VILSCTGFWRISSGRQPIAGNNFKTGNQDTGLHREPGLLSKWLEKPLKREVTENFEGLLKMRKGMEKMQ